MLLLLLFVALMFAFNVALELFLMYHNRRCPDCKKRMKYIGRENTEDGSEIFIFHCPHCHDTEFVPSERTGREHLYD